MHAYSKRIGAGLVLAAGCLLGACRAADMPLPETAGPGYLPAPRSALLGRQDLQFRLAQIQREGRMETILAWEAPGKPPAPVGVITLSGSGKAARVSVQRLPLPDAGAERGDLALATLEYLYTLVLRQDPEAGYCLADIGQACDGKRQTVSHAELLLQLAQARQRVLDAAGAAIAAIPWHALSLAPAQPSGADPDRVSARITGEHGPLAGTTIFFNRAPHSSCAARSGADGLASCHLVDQHGDDDAHAGQDAMPVLALFPGDLRSERVLLPTSLILPPAP